MALTHTIGFRNAALEATLRAGTAITAFDRVAILGNANNGSANYTVAAAINSGDILATFTLNATPFAAAASAASALNAVSNVTGSAAGTAKQFVFYKNAGTAITSAALTADFRMMGIVDVSPNTRDMTIDNTSITVGQTVSISSFTYTEKP